VPTAPQDAQVRLDVVALKNGDQFVGKVTADLDAYIEIRMEDGATIGVSRALVKEVRRGAEVAPSRDAVVRPEDAWFVLHDADGASVGWLHSSVTARQDGSFSINEEYEFVNGVRRYQVTNTCAADKHGRGVRCYFRERVSTPRLRRQMLVDDPLARDDRVEDERIVEAVVEGGALRVLRLDGRGRHERQLPWSDQSTFPMLARAVARQSATCIGPTAMFDPRHEELMLLRVDGTGSRQMMIEGARQSVSEVLVSSAAGDHVGSREWVGVDDRVVRRELAGPALVAIPSSAQTARRAVGVSSIQSAVVAEVQGRFGMWVPSPAWRSIESLPPGHIAFDCDVHDAAVRVSLIDHLDPGTTLETAADAVGNWFSLLYPQFEVTARAEVRVRGRRAVRMQASDARNVQQATVDVIPFDGHFLMLSCRAPIGALDELAGDFAFVRRTIELEGAALNPTTTGPLKQERGGRMRPPTGPLPAPKPASRVGRLVQPGSGRTPR